MRPRWLPLVIRVLLTCGVASWSGCARDLPSSSSRRCRRYATTVEVGGYTRTYALNGSANIYGWGTRSCAQEGRRYASLSDFIEEAQVPNRTRASETFLYNYCGMLNSSGASRRTYTYDDQGRLVASEGSSQWGYAGAASVSATKYTAWDARGRPLSGMILRGGTAIDFSIVYDDGARSMTTSYQDGEEWYVQQDAYGNPIRDGSLTYTVIETEEICL